MNIRPSVFAVEKEYQIMVPSPEPSLMWAEVGDRKFYDDSCGILRSDTVIHRISVPAELLDNTREYTVCYRIVNKRSPYYSDTGEIQKETFVFRPFDKEDDFRIYHISDAHGRIESPVEAAQKFGEIDLLILNGDNVDHSGCAENFYNIYEIGYRVTNGGIPVLFSRGNHDMRGFFAEKLIDYTPNNGGKTYYSFCRSIITCNDFLL